MNCVRKYQLIITAEVNQTAPLTPRTIEERLQAMADAALVNFETSFNHPIRSGVECNFKPIKALSVYVGEDDDPYYEDVFLEDYAVQRLLKADVLMIHDVWVNTGWEGGVQNRTIGLSLNCSDTFAWGGADGEPINYGEIRELYDFWNADKVWGTTKYVCKKRRLKPQQALERRMKEAGAWDDMMENLPDNIRAGEAS